MFEKAFTTLMFRDGHPRFAQNLFTTCHRTETVLRVPGESSGIN